MALVTFIRKNCDKCEKNGRLHEVLSGLAKCVICEEVSLEEA